jgi:hypothetical protein
LSKLSIIIPTRNELPCLWFTLQGLKLQHVDLKQIEVMVLDNEDIPKPIKEHQVIQTEKILKESGLPNKTWLGAAAVKSPYFPRNHGAANASAPWLLFLDSHVLLCDGFLQHVIDSIPSLAETTLTHYPVSFGGDTLYGHYELRLAGDFWGGWKGLRREEVVMPYRIAATGIWAFLVNRDFYLNTLEGFNPNFAGYGGGEPYLDLKVWMLGGEVWLDPRVHGMHYSGPRGYTQQWAERIRNFALAISVVAPSRLSSFAAAMEEKTKLPSTTIEQYIQEGIKAGEDESFRFRKRMKRPLEDVIEMWRRTGVPF